MIRLRTVPLFSTRSGCRVRLDPALPLALAFLAWSLADRYGAILKLRRLVPTEGWLSPWRGGILVAAGALIAIVVAEVVHAGAVRLAGGKLRALTVTFIGGRSHVAPFSSAWRAAFAAPFVMAA